MDAVSLQLRAFLGVRFVLAGFRDEDYRRNVVAKLVGGGGVDVGRYGPDCTHVIVDGLVYDDPVCVAARKDGKAAVTGLWVDHSCDIGVAVDATSIMYRPLKDMNGIPGAASLMVCLTGYQRQDRDDIMMMVRLMGAQFSKPLVATKVTHLICYKFEGEKYELAKKMKKINLVNHLWLEDCLREWEILPETNYSRSGYELEMEAEAKDSEEEEEDKFLKQCQENVTKKSPILNPGTTNSSMSPVLTEHLAVRSPKGLTIADQEIKSNNEVPCLSVDGPKTVCSLIDADAELLPMASNQKTELPTISGYAGTPQPDAKFSTLSYYRRASRMSVSSPGKDESGNADFAKMKFNGSDENVVNNTLMEAMGKISSCLDYVQTPSKTTEVCDAESKGKSTSQGENELSSASRKLAKMDSGHSVGSKFGDLEATTLMDRPGFASSVFMNETTRLHYAEKEKAHFSASEAPGSTARQNAFDLPSTGIVGAGSVVDKDYSRKTCCRSPSMLPNSGLKHVIDRVNDEQPHNQSCEKSVQPQFTDALLPRDQDASITTAFDAARLYFSEGVKNKALGITERRKVPANNTLGRKRNVSRSANVKGSMYLTKGNMDSDNRNSCDLRKEIDFLDKSSNADRTEMPGLTGVIPVTEEANDMMQIKDDELPIYHEMDNETEAPEEIGEPSGENTEDKSDRVNLIEKSDVCVEETSDVTDKGVLHGSASDKMGKASKQNENPCQDQLLDGPKRLTDNLKNAKSSKRPLLTGKLMANPIEDNGSLDMRGSSSHILKRKTGKKQNNCKSSVKVEKENQPRDNSDPDGNQGGTQAVKSGRKKRSIKKDCRELNRSMKDATVFCGDKTEPACFILSGERQQRMQLRKVIQRLKGKLCIDSHRWSYRATHFICPKSVRTEKWFAACASGSWILRPEYISASNQEGKFLDEEPYEWYKTGLSQDGAINLEAPRKWRLLRQRTGHGALYDMRIIIYGECIAPSLETLKRVVKAGDGTILATSPPYTRFLNGKTDFAVISPGMPRVDVWIQEFLKNEIPCVVADYLVEYVCKPGYSLDKHVLYNNHSLAERSFSRLQGKAEEVMGLATPNNEDGGSDIRCNVCGSSDGEEVMLMCGDEAGSVGCRTATHIDCCNPPLEAVPKEDWLCPKCSIKGAKNGRSITATVKRKRQSR